MRRITQRADHVLGTGGMIRRAKETTSRVLIIGTEVGILHRLRKENPDKVFVPASERAICPNMKLTTLEKVLWALERMEHRIQVPEPVRERAYTSVERMIGVPQ